MHGVSLREALQIREMLAEVDDVDGPAVIEVGRVSLAHLGVWLQLRIIR